MRKQQRQTSNVLLDGLYDPDSPIFKLLGFCREEMGEIIWQKLMKNWQIDEHWSVDIVDRQKGFYLK